MSYHGNWRDPRSKTPQLIRYEHAQQVVNSGGSVLLNGRIYTRDNFREYPREVDMAAMSADAAARMRSDIARQIAELEDQQKQLDAAQGAPDEVKNNPIKLRAYLAEQGATTAAPGDPFAEWRRKNAEQAAVSHGPGTTETEEVATRFMSGRSPEEESAINKPITDAASSAGPTDEEIAREQAELDALEGPDDPDEQHPLAHGRKRKRS